VFSLGFILDADKKGIDGQIKYIQEQYKEILPTEFLHLKNGKEGIVHTSHKRIKAIGCYVMTNVGENKGNLEDILLNIMEKGKSKKIFDDAHKFLNDNNFIRYKENSKEKDENKTESDFKKSKIGIAGQLEFSGHDNTEIILKSSYLQGKIHNDDKSNEIIEFISKLRAEIKR